MSGEIRELSCSECGEPLRSETDERDIVCAHCGTRHSSIDPPSDETAHHKDIETGDAVAVRWGNRWWPARITEKTGSGRFHIHFDGWAPAYDDIVGADRIRPRSRHAGEGDVDVSGYFVKSRGVRGVSLGVKVAIGVMALILTVAMGYILFPSGLDSTGASDDSSSLSSMAGLRQTPDNTRPAIDDERLLPGQAVHILWDQSWYRGSVVSNEPNLKVKVHYAGWDSSYDEIVERDRLRVSE